MSNAEDDGQAELAPVDPEARTPEAGASSFLPRHRVVLLTALACVVLWSSIVRYRDPIGEKHFPLLEPGAADFSVIFDGTRVLLDGRNPYFHVDPTSVDRWRRGDIIGGRWFRVSYQPSHFLLYVPVALLTSDNREAGRIVFLLSVVLYLVIAYQTWWLVLRAGAPAQPLRRLAALLLPVFALLLLENVGSQLSLARCQSDVVNAALCWGAMALFLGGRRFWPLFMVTSAVAIKGYPVVLAAGLLFLSMRRREWLRAAAGAVVATVFWLLPVLPYLHDGAIAAVSHAVGFFTPMWFNHSFRNLFFHIAPSLADPGRQAAFAFMIVVSAASWWNARLALSTRNRESATLWLCLATTASLLTMVGYSTLSFIYNQILILPGVLILLTTGDALWRECGLPSRLRTLAFSVECVVGVLVFKYVFPPLALPLAAVGNALLALLLGMAVAARLVVQRRGASHR